MHIRFLLMLTLISMGSAAQEFNLFVGTYTNSGSKGIYVYRFNSANGTTRLLHHTDSANNPSFLALSPNGNNLYAANETNGKNPGQVSAYQVDQSSGRLQLLNQQLSGGDDPCYVAVDKRHRWVMVGNYSGGSATALAVNPNGSLQPAAQVIQHHGSGANKKKQEKAHVHATVFSPDQNFLLTPDLGTDKVMVYAFDPSTTRPLKPATPSFTAVSPGGGPRHLTFHPNNRFAYLVEELTGMVSAFKYLNGKLTPVQRISSHPAGYKGDIGSADIHVSPDGKFLYASNRGDANSLAIYAVNATTGRLQLKGFQSTLGKAPRNFAIDPTGKFLLVANQETNNIVVFKRNLKTGLLTATNDQIEVPKPVCLIMR